jgi:hypothetical protein
MNTNGLSINSWNAALYYCALDKAIAATDALLKLKSSAPFVTALAIERSAYKAELEKIGDLFPHLKDEATPK